MSYDHQSFGDGEGLEFTEKSIRMGFIRKVYLILTGQLTVTFGFVALFSLNEGVQKFVHENTGFFWGALVGTIICIIALSCCSNLRRKTPHNYIFLFIFTICEGFLLGCASATYAPKHVLIAVGICIAVTVALTLFAFQTRIDFTVCSGFVYVSLIILVIFGFFAMIFQSEALTILYSSLGAMLFSFYLVFDTQMMIGGTHKYSLSPEEYIFAALTLYLDIVNLFMYILAIVNRSN